ncbi:right-handed parallel beta-helix repeat-containing protein [Methanobrevibacter sp. TMH8]|uniref:beta strand repeat-containing protein n=1 Tax=Methanobrevibacter sp. TMH8 TaxID=2848611 RepID=UPI001CCF28E6|nr:right-handed parallel beta-helix repeat-containing protein [Methanobrevibacter sp. TMH8]MBZ9570718.1 right-handed parallel beta-helix repeat-containing protein [Methanobrevibacter sp. TMH8]
MDTSNSNNTITFTNNNITGTSGFGVSLSAYSSNNTITFTSNNITGTSGDGVYLYVGSSNNTITLTSNNIIATGAGVYLSAYSSNNTITLTSNNITGTGAGVDLSAHSSNNTISLTNNNITGTSGDGVYMDTSNSNNTITFTNNNITGTSGGGVSLSTYSSNNTITFTNNNITGTSGDGVYLYADSSNNTITLTSNNITGTVAGVDLSVYGSNNTVTLTSNNITGTSGSGVELYAYSNNTILNFIGNNITGISYAMYFYSYDQFSGLSLLNNTFKSDDVGLYFVLGGTVLSDILVKGNTIFAVNKGIGFVEYSPSSVNLTVNYNRIIASVGLDFTTTDAGSNFDYNWWGINDISSKIINFNINNHYILNITNLTSLANVHHGDKVNFALLVLNTTLTNVGVENLPYFVITGLFNGESYNTTTDDLFVHQFTIPSGGIQTIDDLLDEQYVSLEFNASKGNTSSTIVVPDNASTSKTVDIIGIATDNDGNPLANIVITVTVDGVTHNVTTDSNGRWYLAYKPTRTGNVNVSVFWTGNNDYNGFENSTHFNVKKGNINVFITVIENSDGSVTIVANVTNEDGDPLADFPVDFILNGKSVGSKTTDKNGIASITIPANKLKNGKNIITVKVSGGSNFNDAVESTEFTVSVNGNKSSDNPVSNAAMKKTGMPIFVLFVLAIFSLLAYRRKK